MTYTIKKMSDAVTTYDFKNGFDINDIEGEWTSLETAEISDNEWLDQYPDSYKAFAKVGWNKSGLHVLMYAIESPILACAQGWNGRPCQDSCLEFFFNAFPAIDNRYMNFEVNPIGAVCAAIGEGRHERSRFDSHIDGVELNTGVFKDGVWAVSYTIPMSHIEKHYGKKLESGHMMKGNFYTCSENIHPHFATWNHVIAPHPDFHRPECFGNIIIE